jgi:hypothetical protein
MLGNQEIIELAAAIEELGGTLTEDQASKLRATKSPPKKVVKSKLPLRSLSLPLSGITFNQ